jgi:hypothetical protein
MPRNYKRPQHTKLYGEANALTIARVGSQKLSEFLSSFGLPVSGTWSHFKTDIESLWADGSLRNAVAYFTGKIQATGRDTRFELVVPLVIREGVILDPAIFRTGEKTDIFTKDAIDALFTAQQFPRPLLDRDYMYAPPPLPGTVPPHRSVVDVYHPWK